MRRISFVVSLVVFAFLVSACTRKSEQTTKVEAAHVEKNDETGLADLTLTEHASRRLGITTAPVLADGVRQSVPYAAVIYDDGGGTWVYTSPEPLNFVREEILVERIHGDTAVLTSGPAVGTAVVTVGVAELYGAESGVGH